MKRLLVLLVAMFVTVSAWAAAPVIFYTDVVNGPASGGEGGHGTYLSIFGRNFGADIAAVTVTINNQAVAQKMVLATSKGRTDVQQLTVQVHSATTTGAIKVTVGGLDSNTDHTFTVMAGRILFFSLTGNNGTGVPGDITHPYRSPNFFINEGAKQNGDVYVVRGGTWSDDANGFYFHNVSGASNGWLTLISYPGETVNIVRSGAAAGMGTGIHAFYNLANGTQGYYAIAGFHVDMVGGGGGVIGISENLTNIRIVNNEAANMYEDAGGSAAISGSGTVYKILGNHVHDNGGSKLYHGLYFDGRALVSDDYELAWNHIEKQTGGRGIQIFADSAPATSDPSNVVVHHNLIHDIHLDCLLYGDNTTTGQKAYNNIIYNCSNAAYQGPSTDAGSGGSCIRMNSANGLHIQIYNNTLYNCAMDDGVDSTAVLFQDVADNGVEFYNNIVHTNALRAYSSGVTAGKILGATNNLFFGSGAAPSWSTSGNVNSDPLFTTNGSNFNLQSGSPARDVGTATLAATNDHVGVARPQGGTVDMGALEYASGAGGCGVGQTCLPIRIAENDAEFLLAAGW